MTDVEAVHSETRSFLEEYPEHETTLETLLEREQQMGAWTFHDASVDSGAFGELVSRPFVETTESGDYRFVDRRIVETALDSKELETNTEKMSEPGITFSLSHPVLDTRAVVGLSIVLLLVVATRSLFYSAIFRSGHIVSPSNDPYFYRYWQAELLSHSSGPMDREMLATVGELTHTRPLTHTLNWWFADLLGGSQSAGLVAVFQPLVATLLLVILLYALVITLTADHRIALGSVLLLAVTPIHVVYTAAGFLEHRPYQYLWLGVIAFALVWLAVDLTRRTREGQTNPAAAHARAPRAWAVAAVLALAVGAMAHTWGGSPLSFVPLGLYLAVRVVADSGEQVSPLLANGPALGGIGIGSFLALVAHLRWGWHEPIAAIVPLLVAVGGVAVGVVATLWLHRGLPPTGLLVAEAAIGALGIGLFWFLRRDDFGRLLERSNDLFDRDFAVETASLFTTDYAILFGPLSQIGLGFYFAVLPLGVVTYYVVREYEPAWLVVVCFTWYYLLLATIQIRFAAQFALFCAVFGAIGLLSLLSALNLVRAPAVFQPGGPEGPSLAMPETPRVGTYLVGIIAAVLLFNLIFVPTLLFQTQYSDEQFEAALTISEHAEQADRDYPQNFVLSEWGDNRMYNYFVSGESERYDYAQANYRQFIYGTDPDDYYDQFDNRVGYVVLTETGAPDESIQAQLFDELGAGSETAGHYKLLYSEDDVRVFAVVEGAVIRTRANPGELMTVRTDIETAGEAFTYERTVTADDDGEASVRVAYPGTYEINGQSVTVSEKAVYEGRELTQ